MSAGVARRCIAAGAFVTVVGLGLVSTLPVTRGGGEPAQSALDPVRAVGGGLAVLAGWVVLGWGIHRFGRESDG